MSIQVLLVKRVDAQAELLRFAANFVERGKPVVNIERRILESLRHDWPGELLEFEHELHVFLARLRIQVFREAKQQDVAKKIENRFLDRGIAAFS